jgi:peptidoglycan hydrolase CwlO-like protein
MDESNNSAAIVALLSGLFSAGAFKFYEVALKNKRESTKEMQEEHLKYRNDLIKRVDKLEFERAQQIKFLMTLKSEVAALTVEVSYLQRENRKLQRDPRH